ncbi:MAG: hypothetical protein EAX81_01935 [Candidatus Thorarchaeota archaeon]|nr:hypothetical protein [Candidatus Thorarchaeota archaeon]
MKTSSEDFFKRHSLGHDRLADAVAPSDVFDRQFGAQLAAWEIKQHQNFKSRFSGTKYQIQGFVHLTQDTRMILITPSPWLLEGEFALFSSDTEPPPDGSFVEISGRFVTTRPAGTPKSPDIRVLYVDEHSTLPEDYLDNIEPPMNLRNFSALLFENVGMAEASKRVFARLFMSSPPLQDNVGGLSAGIQAIASNSQVKRLLSFIRGILPPTLRGRWNAKHNVRGISVLTPRMWRLSIGQLRRQTAEALCLKRFDPRGFREVSLGVLTDSTTSSLPDIPLALAHEDFWVEMKNPAHLQLPVLKSSITYQMLFPKISQRTIDAGTKYVLAGLEDLKESFALDDASLARGHLLDADIKGRPLSTIRLAQSSARGWWNDKITAKDVKRSWSHILEPALKEFIELTELQNGLDAAWGKDRPIHKFNTKILRALRKLDTGKKGDLGPTLEEIAAEAGVERHVAARELLAMKDSGALYEPRNGHYRLV